MEIRIAETWPAETWLDSNSSAVVVGSNNSRGYEVGCIAMGNGYHCNIGGGNIGSEPAQFAHW